MHCRRPGLLEWFESFNPKLNAWLAKAMPLGDPFCEIVHELQK
jgi:hypothetical protein